MQQQLKDKVLRVLNDNEVGTLATVVDNKPQSRYMTFFHDDLTLYTATNKETHKTETIKENPYVHVLVGYDGKGIGDAYLEVEGKASVHESEQLKKDLWNEHLSPWFEGPEDPNYVVLKIVPSQIRLMNNHGEEPDILRLH